MGEIGEVFKVEERRKEVKRIESRMIGKGLKRKKGKKGRNEGK